MSDEILMDVFHRMQIEGSLKRVFYEGHLQTAEQFVDMLKQPHNIPVIVTADRQAIGFAWLNGVSGSTAHAHFCFLQKAWGHHTQDAGRLLIKYWLSLDAGSGKIFDVLIGVIPIFNRAAIRFAQRVGFKKLGEIPRMSRLASGEKTEATILYYARG